MAGITVDNPIGRYCEIRAEASVLLEHMTAFRARLATIFNGIAGRAVIASDLTACVSVPDKVVEALVAIARIDNPKIERHGLLVRENSPLGTQIATVVDAAHSASRRVFTTGHALRTWLDPVLSPDEARRLAVFIW